jgi:protein-L-isoaspartate O-methyltransferase
MAERLAVLAGLDEQWRRAFAQVPREAFLPQIVWRDQAGTAERVDRALDPRAWWALVYDERCSIVTQLDDGAEDGPGLFTSSSSAPVVMARMLAQLPGDARRVAEAGSGTGWNAALLAHRYGAGNVVTVELDPALARRARHALTGAGFPVRVVESDALAEPPGGPYDALIATFAVSSVPAAWLAAVPRGRIVVPFTTRWLNTAVAVLDVAEGTGAGRFMTGFAFMAARQHRDEHTRPVDLAGGRTSAGRLDPWLVSWRHEPAAFAISLLLPGLDYWVDDRDEAFMVVWDGAGSWAVVETSQAGGRYAVRQAGPRALWDEVEAAYQRWASWGRPSPDRFGISVHSNGEGWFWLDAPDHVVGAVPLSAPWAVAA